MTVPPDSLQGDVRRGVLWSTLNNLTLRAGSLVLGIVLARLLTPEEFGVYAIALTVQVVLITLADLGLSADLIRSDDPDRRAPTVATLSLVAGCLLAGLMVLTAQPLAELLGSPGSAGVIAALSITIVLAGAGVVPFAQLTRRFQQKALFAIAMTDFLISSLITVSLVLLGWGVMSLAVGRVVAQLVSLVLQFVLSGVRPRYGVDRAVLGSVLRFGLPLAAANLLSWMLLSLDNVVIARVAGPTTLGFYVLAFNISSWPMNAIGQVVRAVALPTFARLAPAAGGRDRSLASGMALAWSIALPAGMLLAALSEQLIALLYGSVWAPAVPALVALGFFGALRVAFDLMASYLLSRGRTRSLLWIQVLWLVGLLPTLVVATHRYGISGAAWAHVVVAVVVILPAYLVAARRSGADLVAVAHALWPPSLAAVPAGLVALAVAGRVEGAFLGLLCGGLAGVLVYAACLGRWLSRRVPRDRGEEGAPGLTPDLVDGSGAASATPSSPSAGSVLVARPRGPS